VLNLLITTAGALVQRSHYSEPSIDMTLSYGLILIALRTPLAKGRHQQHMTESHALRSYGNTFKNSYYGARKGKQSTTTNGISQSYLSGETWLNCLQKTYGLKIRNYSLGGLDPYEYSSG
jgi:hypothetical protein